MTDKEFKHLKRSALLEIILAYQKREQELQAEIDTLKTELHEKEQKINESTAVSDAIAKLDSIMNSALQTTDRYLTQVKDFCTDSEKRAAEILENAKKEADALRNQKKDD